MKRHTVLRTDLQKRLARSIIAGLIFFTFALGTFLAIRFGPTYDKLPIALRKAQSFNAVVASKLQSSTRTAPCKDAPPKGTKPRVNGMIGLHDDIDGDAYRMIVDSGSKHLELTMDDVMSLPRTEAVNDFKCVEGWTQVLQYAGVRFSDFMKIKGVGLHDDGTPYRYVGMETPDRKYYVSIDQSSMMSPDTVIAWEMDGAELDLENGYPFRLIIPSKYGIKNLKRIGHIFFADERPPDYWNKRGYDWYSGL
jgi:DMSO/TMAO reductase YedYZ molybdopterin-dependent catalytic subunit